LDKDNDGSISKQEFMAVAERFHRGTSSQRRGPDGPPWAQQRGPQGPPWANSSRGRSGFQGPP
jgi:hypothetical protein